MFILSTQNMVGVNVTGCLTAPDGTEQPFDFVLQCERLDAAELEKVTGPDSTETAGAFFARVTKGWLRVYDEAKQELAFSQESLAQVLKIPGLARLAFHAYLQEVRAREKK